MKRIDAKSWKNAIAKEQTRMEAPEGANQSQTWCNVPDSDELTGRISFSSRLPQYLTTAMLTGAVHVTLTESAVCAQNAPAKCQMV